MGTRFKEARLNRCMFQEIPTSLVFTLIIWLRFERSIFYGEADFIASIFYREANFAYVGFNGPCYFGENTAENGTKFYKAANFQSTEFDGYTRMLPGQWC
jgi:hypothetical protein